MISRLKSYLKLLNSLIIENILNLKSLGFLKTLVFKSDERLLFVLDRHLSKHINLEELVDQLHLLIIRESESLFNCIYSQCSTDLGNDI